jgi:signal transduction histidine kinase
MGVPGRAAVEEDRSVSVNRTAVTVDAAVEPTFTTSARDAALGSAVLAAALLGLTVAIVVIGLRARVIGGIAAVNVVAFGLTLAWAAVGFVIGRRRGSERGNGQVAAGFLVAVDSLAASVALTAGRVAVSTGGSHGWARAVATIAAPSVTALSFHLLLSLPDGRLVGKVRRAAVVAVDVSLVGIGIGLAASHRDFSLQAGAASWSIAAALALPAMRARYIASAGRDRDRLQWLGIGAVVAGDVALVAGVLHALVGWPGPLGAVAAVGTGLIPIGLVLGDVERLATGSGRIFVHVLSIVGFTVVVSLVYLLVVLGLGHAPTHSADREVLALSMLAAGVAAVGYVPARDRFFHSATRFVYGSRQAPDEVLRTFGSRLTRAIPMDELLLQLAESLRKTMALTSAEVFTGMGDVLERAVSVPDQGPRSLVVTGKERPVVTRAGVSGNAWASVWLPELLDGRQAVQLRVAPISHAGELLGLIVVERPANANAFGEDDDRVLTDLARQVGLAFHNSQLDTALQTTLDELRKQADALRESRARIVASGDAERRRVERNLHDGAQQRLVALAVNLRLAREIIAEDPSEGGELLDQLATEVQETIQELRELAHGIYPPLLVDSGLGEALRAAANRSPLSVQVLLEDVGRYSSEVEAAVYFCCLEALQNAAKHAPESHVTVRVWQESGGLLFAVSDDGPGFDVERAQRGHGFTNMADRLGAIGGTVRWESEPGQGAVIRGSLPLI